MPVTEVSRPRHEQDEELRIGETQGVSIGR
jgi:hypothetical protein